MIKVLNTRVDTARDLVLKLFNTTNEMLKTAQLAEMAIVYGNRYRTISKDIDKGLENAEMLYLKGSYKEALDLSISSIELVDFFHPEDYLPKIILYVQYLVLE